MHNLVLVCCLALVAFAAVDAQYSYADDSYSAADAFSHEFEEYAESTFSEAESRDNAAMIETRWFGKLFKKVAPHVIRWGANQLIGALRSGEFAGQGQQGQQWQQQGQQGQQWQQQGQQGQQWQQQGQQGQQWQQQGQSQQGQGQQTQISQTVEQGLIKAICPRTSTSGTSGKKKYGDEGNFGEEFGSDDSLMRRRRDYEDEHGAQSANADGETGTSATGTDRSSASSTRSCNVHSDCFELGKVCCPGGQTGKGKSGKICRVPVLKTQRVKGGLVIKPAYIDEAKADL